MPHAVSTVLSLLVSSVFTALLTAQAAPPQAKTIAPAGTVPGTVPGIVLQQESGFVLKFTVQATPSAVRVENLTHDYCLISQSPDWQVYVIRPKEKTMSVVSHRDWCHKYRVHQLSWTAGLTKPQSAKRSESDGHPVTIYRYGATETVPSLLEMRSMPERVAAPTDNHAEIVVLDYPGGDKTGPIAGKVRGLPALPGFILSADRVETNGKTISAIRTKSIKYDAKINPAIFRLPTDCKTVPFTTKLLETAAANDNARSLIQDFMAK